MERKHIKIYFTNGDTTIFKDISDEINSEKWIFFYYNNGLNQITFYFGGTAGYEYIIEYPSKVEKENNNGKKV